ncbi:hypothetical protein PENNAL_c0038G01987 [Penicillium nalgiovense]|uniref:Uncharacterized protein n=1 Tax=Penicillium nalgiovense TaxID=60175 RepID=A0A1V6Y3U4_PENNA|nr:hypothetical protein PENNAL_c0038G01987 [Penicillium nalgiovense]
MTIKPAQVPFNHDLEIQGTDTTTQRTAAPPDQESLPYSAFSLAQKRWIIALVAFAGWFSSLSSFIYFPAIPSIASDLDVSTEQINLTVTAYLIMSGIFPSIVGNAADTLGRRPVFRDTSNMVQSAGISGSYIVTYGVLGDLFTPSERGGYSGVVSFSLNTPPSVGPVISGLLMSRWGWRSIFWFPAAISPCCLLAIILFLPETSRHVVGDGCLVSGLTYLPFGIACAISAFAAGKLLDIEYRSAASRHKTPVDQSKNHNFATFPVQEARLRIVRYFLLVCCLLVVGYGWSLQCRAVVFTSASIILVDLHPEGTATTQAANNFVRREMSAGMLALLNTNTDQWKGQPSIPNISIEDLEDYIEGENKNLFLQFMRKMLQWDSDDRRGASDLKRSSRLCHNVAAVLLLMWLGPVCRPDALALQGVDAGGHEHGNGASIVSLIPEVADALSDLGIYYLPLIAAWGIVDGRGCAFAFALGASGIVMGTRFLAAKNASVPAVYRDAIFEASDGGETTARSRVFDEIWGPNVRPKKYDGRCFPAPCMLQQLGT